MIDWFCNESFKHIFPEFDQVIKGDLKGQDLQKVMEEYNKQAFDDFNKKALLPCEICGRTFLPRPLEIHARACKPNGLFAKKDKEK